VIVLGRSPEEAFSPFRNLEIKPFRDASPGVCTYDCTVLDCLKGLQYAIKLGWFSLEHFDHEHYEFYSQLENGDLCEIIPNKFIAFSSPSDSRTDHQGVNYSFIL
jgi:cell division cycle 14